MNKAKPAVKPQTISISTEYAEVTLPLDILEAIHKGERFRDWRGKYCLKLKSIFDKMLWWLPAISGGIEWDPVSGEIVDTTTFQQVPNLEKHKILHIAKMIGCNWARGIEPPLPKELEQKS